MFFGQRKSPPDEKELIDLVEQAKRGDEIAFGDLYELLVSSIFQFIYFRVETRVEAEDLTQETFTKAYEHLSRFHGGSFRAWIYTIARNTLVDYYRTKKKHMVFDETISEPAAKPSDKDVVAIDKLKRALHRLPDQQREVIIWRYIQDQSVETTAKILRLSKENVRVLSHRGLKTLEKLLIDLKGKI